MWWPERSNRRLGLSDQGASLFGRPSWAAREQVLQSVRFGPNPSAQAWPAALAPLSGWLRPRPRARRLTVTLSDRLTRWQLVPWPTGVRRPAELEAVVRAHFEQVYGRAAEGWSLRLSDPAPGQPVVACAIDGALLQALQEMCAANGVRLARVEPYLVGMVRQWRRVLRAPAAWLAVVEPGHLCLAHVRSGRWRSIRTQRCGESWQSDLAGLHARMSAIDGGVDGHARHYLAGQVAPNALPAGSPWQLLQPSAPLHGAPAADAAAPLR